MRNTVDREYIRPTAAEAFLLPGGFTSVLCNFLFFPLTGAGGSAASSAADAMGAACGDGDASAPSSGAADVVWDAAARAGPAPSDACAEPALSTEFAAAPCAVCTGLAGAACNAAAPCAAFTGLADVADVVDVV